MFGVFFFTQWIDKRDHQAEVAVIHDTLEFITVENPNPQKYLTVISTIKAVDILVVSKHFYQHEEYWSYIYRDNKLDNLLNIPARTVVRIPLIDSVGQKNSLARAKLLGDKLLQKHFSRIDD